MTETKTSVRKLITAVELLMDKYAENLTLIANGEAVTTPIDDKTIDTMIKIIKEMTSFEQFEKIANPELVKRTKSIEQKPIDNMFEHAVTQVKKNGNSKI